MGTGGWRFGAGRPGWHMKAEHCLRLDVRALARLGAMACGSYNWRWTDSATGQETGSIGLHVTAAAIGLSFMSGGQSVTQTVPIERTSCNYGGTRPWLRCPACRRRIAVLYHRGGLFRCRRCSGVVYGSQSDDAMGRAWRRQNKLEARLGENWRRPKGMHHATRDRLLGRILDREELRDRTLADFIMKMDARIRRRGGLQGL